GIACCSMSVDASIDATCIARHRSADGYWLRSADGDWLRAAAGRDVQNKTDSGHTSTASITFWVRQTSWNVMKPGIQCVLTRWNPGFIATGGGPGGVRRADRGLVTIGTCLLPVRYR